MLREILTLVVPLLLPTVLYLAWVRLTRWSESESALFWQRQPWIWLAAIGVALTALVLVVVTVGFGTAVPGIYVPPHAENGRIVPGHVVPAKP
jgi:hypothetical protein